MCLNVLKFLRKGIVLLILLISGMQANTDTSLSSARTEACYTSLLIVEDVESWPRICW